jgi:hypothetical protein
MQEDKLHAAERIRLEALAQAVASSGAMAGRVQTASDILKRAAAYENYIITGKLPRQPGPPQ